MQYPIAVLGFFEEIKFLLDLSQIGHKMRPVRLRSDQKVSQAA